jgi:SAM-dependent methyltransferase
VPNRVGSPDPSAIDAGSRQAPSTVTGSGCPACGARAEAIRADDRFSDRLSACSACGLRWNPHPPVGEELTRLYTTGFYEGGPPRAGGLAARLHRLNGMLRLRELDGLEPGRLLDVGSGKGRFLDGAREAGWHVVGVEFAAAAAAESRARGLDVRVGDILDVELEGPFDAVTFWHVLEHLPDPGAALDRVRDLMPPGGRLIVSVPNLDSFQARLFGPAWFHLDLARHLHHFTPGSLRQLLQRHGFVVDRVGFFYPEMEAAGLVQSSLNRLGFEADRLYRFLKRDPTATQDAQTAASIGLAVALAPVAAAWSLVAPLVSSGASMQVVAHRG